MVSTDTQEVGRPARGMVTAYDAYMQGYGRQFNPNSPIPANEMRNLFTAYNQICTKVFEEGKDRVRILDYGCGDGSRFLGTYLEMAKQARALGKNLDITGYDISPEAIHLFEKSLTERGFTKNVYNDQKTIFTKDNLKISLVLGKETDSIATTKPLLQNGEKQHHLVMSMYGPISHIPTRVGRRAILEMLNDLCSEHFMCTVPGKGRFRPERKHYAGLRRNGTPADDATEQGDLYYSPATSPEQKIFYHVYAHDELQRDLSATGFDNVRVGVLSVLPPKHLTWHPWLNLVDGAVSNFASRHMRHIPEAVLEQAGYFVAHADKTNSLALSAEGSPVTSILR